MTGLKTIVRWKEHFSVAQLVLLNFQVLQNRELPFYLDYLKLSKMYIT